jgi:hypothetical protein
MTSERFEIQGRRRSHPEGGPVRDESRLARTEKLDDALKAANTWAHEGFTVWVYRVEQGNSVSPIYHSVSTFRPHPSTSATPDRRPNNRDSQAFARVA